jgi:hypothetical protein
MSGWSIQIATFMRRFENESFWENDTGEAARPRTGDSDD